MIRLENGDNSLGSPVTCLCSTDSLSFVKLSFDIYFILYSVSLIKDGLNAFLWSILPTFICINLGMLMWWPILKAPESSFVVVVTAMRSVLTKSELSFIIYFSKFKIN